MAKLWFKPAVNGHNLERIDWTAAETLYRPILSGPTFAAVDFDPKTNAAIVTVLIADWKRHRVITGPVRLQRLISGAWTTVATNAASPTGAHADMQALTAIKTKLLADLTLLPAEQNVVNRVGMRAAAEINN